MKMKTVIVGLSIAIAVLGAAWYFLGQKPAAICPFSGRTIHAQTRAWITIGGKKYETCCVRCAITEARQTGKPLRILEVADFETGKLIHPEKAWFVEGSMVNLCMRMSPGMESPDQQTVYLRGFDRCSPSILAFSNERLARAFIAKSGGTLTTLSKLEIQAQPESHGARQ